MKRHLLLAAALIAAFLAGSLVQSGRAAYATGSNYGHLVGHVSLSPGVSATSCKISFPNGTPMTATCDAYGNFVLQSVPPGFSNLTVAVPGNPYGVPARTIEIAVPSGYETGDAGDIVLGKPGAIAGRIHLPPTDDTALYDQVYVGIPSLGVYAPVGLDGQYLLTGVGPGTYTVEVTHPAALHFATNPNIAGVVVGSGRLVNLSDPVFTPAVPLVRAP